MANNPYYYSLENAVPVSDLEEALKKALKEDVVGFLAGKFVDKIDELLKKPGSSETFRFLVKSVASSTLSTTATESFTISDETVKEIAGGTAKDIALWIISQLPQSRIVALAVGALSVAENLIWTAIEEVGEIVSESDIVNLIYGTIPVDIQIVDQNNNVIGGVLFKEGLSEEQELEAIQNLLGRTLSTRFPDISIGRDRIRVVEDTVFFPQEKEYKVYDGRFVDAISDQLGIAKEVLLGLGQENSPNTNAQIYYESTITFNSKSFVFASDENRFFVPLPNTTGGVSPVGLHPSNIISGSSGNDTLDAFQDRDPNKQNVLLLGLEGNDIINGNVEDDIIVGGKGNDMIDGGLGTDIAIFSDAFENYDSYLTANGSTIFYHARGTQADGVDTLRGVEFAKFQDQIVPLPLNIPTTNPAPKPNLLSKGINIKQIGSDNIITGEAIISGSYIYWEDKTNRVLSLNTNTLEIKEITNSGLDSEFLYGFWYEFARGNESGLVENNKIAVRLKTSNGSLPSRSDDVALYDGNSLISIGAVSNISVFDTQAIWQQNGLVSAYDYDSKRINILADNRFGNISGLPTFPSSNSSEFSISNKSVAWLGRVIN